METYKIFIETDDTFRICAGNYADFPSAKAAYANMIADLVGKQKETLFGNDAWEEFKAELPEEIKKILHGYETEGSAPAQADAEGDTDNYHYKISGNYLEIIDSEDAEYAPNYSLQTNTLGMDGSKEEYQFRIWASTGMMTQEALIVRLIHSA
ncbi:MAG: hypothetical protein J1E00_05365 [Oscillospiraceae bacterium]|nr:hypothetical protein [Oscillospiraceae bacterium]